MDLISGGHYAKKGYYYKLYITFPSYESSKCKNILNKEHKVNKLSLQTGFCLTRNPNYVNLVFRLLGFGLGLEIHVKDEVNNEVEEN